MKFIFVEWLIIHIKHADPDELVLLDINHLSQTRLALGWYNVPVSETKNLLTLYATARLIALVRTGWQVNSEILRPQA